MAIKYSPRISGRSLSRDTYRKKSPQESYFKESRVLREHYMRQILGKELKNKMLRTLSFGQYENESEVKKLEGVCRRMTKCWMDDKVKYGPRKIIEGIIQMI